MSIRKTVANDGKDITIEVSGRFEFNLYRDFRGAYSESARDAHFKVDLSRVEYMDSSALGMLLLLRDHAGGDSGHVVLSGIGANLRKIFEIAGFTYLFSMA